MKVLVIARKNGAVYDAHAPRYPGCTASGATLDEVQANMAAALRQRLSDEGKLNSDSVEVFLAEDVWQESKKGDGLDDVYNQTAREFDVLGLEEFMDFDPEKALAESVDLGTLLGELDEIVKEEEARRSGQ